jgi:sigma-B regulation protein RsbU (phosphoserine phosphatase)
VISLGELQLDGAEAIASARRKVASVAGQLLGDGVAASRLGAVTSAVGKELLRANAGAALGLHLRAGGHSGELVMEFHGDLTDSGVLRLSAFFDRVDIKAGGVTAVLAYDGVVDGDRLARLQTLVQQKTRDELMQEVREQNLALEESLENLKRTRSARDRLESELNIGREIQMSMLPLTFPAFPEHDTFDIFATLHPAQQVGGDFYDMFLIGDRRLCFCVGDVSGKGVPAALFMAVTKTLIKSFAAHELSPARILEQVNQEQSVGNDSCMFVTILLAVLDIRTGQLTYSNAGHNPPLLRRNSGLIDRLDARHGPIIGAMENLVYGEDSLQLQAGDLVYLYTDGINEAMNANRELYGEERLLTTLESLPGSASAEAVVQGTVNPVWAYQGDAPQADDVTVLVMSFRGASQAAAVPTLSLLLDNREAEIGRAIAEMNSFAESQGIPVDIQRKIATCLDEMLANIISYGYEPSAEHQIDLTVTQADTDLLIEIRDDGIAFDPFSDDPPDTMAPVEERSIGGLGCHLVKNLMDECTYRREDGFNIATLRKQLQ